MAQPPADAATQNALNNIRNCLEHTLSPQSNTRKNAEKILDSLSTQPNYTLLLIRILESDQEKMEIRLGSALLFKNFVKKNWEPEKPNCISTNEKELVKQHLVDLICRMPEAIQKQLSEALATIGEHDFPQDWNYLLQQLVDKLKQETDWRVRNGVLMTANTIFKRFRNAFKSDALFLELKHCLQEPLLQLFKQTGVVLRQGNAVVSDQAEMLKALRTMCRIFYSLNWQDIPEYFEDHIAEWMQAFLSYFDYSNSEFVSDDNEDEPGLIDLLLVGIVENINLYAEKYDEEFKPYLEKFTEVIWHLLAQKISMHPKHDELAAKSMRFLTSIAARAHNRALFASPDVLGRLCDIVVSNLSLRTADEELFEDNPMDYIRRDIEGSDTDSRRSAARELIRGLLNNFEEDVSRICMNVILSMLQDYKANPTANWGKKDVSINLFIALAAIKQSRLRGVSQVNPRVPLMDFFMGEVLPELQSNSVTMILKADAIKFVSTFRVQLPVTAMEALLPLLIQSLDPAQFVVHTYAAACIERLLSVKDETKLRFDTKKLAPQLAMIFQQVFAIIEQPGYPENDYLMRLIMRLINVAKEDILPLTEFMVTKLTQTLSRICANPSNPTFSHYLFEAISVLILNVCKLKSGAIETFEALLFPPFQTVLTNDVEALSPYVYQVLAQMLELREAGASVAYMSMFPILLAPTLWETTSNTPAIVKLLEAYMRKAPTEVAQSIQGVLGVFQKLISLRSTEHSAFLLLRALFCYMSIASYQAYLSEIIKILMIRLQSRMAGKNSTAYTKELVYTLSVLIGKQNPNILLDTLEALQPGMSIMLLNSVWTGGASHSKGQLERKACVIGLIRLACETTLCRSQGELWGKLVTAAINVLESPDSAAPTKGEEEALLDLEQTGYEAGYSKLYFATVTSADYLQEYGIPQLFLVQNISKLSQSEPGKYKSYSEQLLPKPTLQTLLSYLTKAGLAIQ
ncbi:unnamed protein product [Albugo candida]|uniref:Importin N-terminal domain-containing protein n=1 Tax=Albugo candida TaxID=65357 RepID=A0A024GS59_9STRA|nr:unnamed protein product [Albugo candida]|eukprot:CCI49622.1 unnamed protein product [Albugo candida]